MRALQLTTRGQTGRLMLSSLIVLLLCLPNSSSWAENVVNTLQTEVPAETVKVYFRNDSGWFRTIDLIYYIPGDDRGDVKSRFLLPWQRFNIELPEGTKIYVAKGGMLERYLNGQSLKSLPPDITLRLSDSGETYGL